MNHCLFDPIKDVLRGSYNLALIKIKRNGIAEVRKIFFFKTLINLWNVRLSTLKNKQRDYIKK